MGCGTLDHSLVAFFISRLDTHCVFLLKEVPPEPKFLLEKHISLTKSKQYKNSKGFFGIPRDFYIYIYISPRLILS